MKPRIFALACTAFVACAGAEAQPNLIQTNRLQLGWNLIAFQVLPTNPSPAVVFATNAFRAVWTFDNATGRWSQFARPLPGQTEQNGVLPMGNVELGRA